MQFAIASAGRSSARCSHRVVLRCSVVRITHAARSTLSWDAARADVHRPAGLNRRCGGRSYSDHPVIVIGSAISVHDRRLSMTGFLWPDLRFSMRSLSEIVHRRSTRWQPLTVDLLHPATFTAIIRLEVGAISNSGRENRHRDPATIVEGRDESSHRPRSPAPPSRCSSVTSTLDRDPHALLIALGELVGLGHGSSIDQLERHCKLSDFLDCSNFPAPTFRSADRSFQCCACKAECLTGCIEWGFPHHQRHYFLIGAPHGDTIFLADVYLRQNLLRSSSVRKHRLVFPA